jgi:hypothetical protein
MIEENITEKVIASIQFSIHCSVFNSEPIFRTRIKTYGLKKQPGH